MNKEEAIAFLKLHQPMPPVIYWTDELVKEYELVRKYFLSNPDTDCIPLFLHSLGEGDGFGIYPLVKEIFHKFKTEEMLPFLVQALHSEYESVKYHAAQISSDFPDERLIRPLVVAIASSNPDTRLYCFKALEKILTATSYDYAEYILQIIENRLLIETEKIIIDLLILLKAKIKINKNPD